MTNICANCQQEISLDGPSEDFCSQFCQERWWKNHSEPVMEDGRRDVFMHPMRERIHTPEATRPTSEEVRELPRERTRRIVLQAIYEYLNLD